MQNINKQKKILFLGGAYAQIPILDEAKKMGFYIITCDYLPDNPGHKIADEYHNVSTTDMKGVLSLAKRVKPDFVVAYASDPAAPVAAFVSDKLGLPGNPYNSVRILSEKDLFRKYLKDNGFVTPEIIQMTEKDNTGKKLCAFKFPYIIKPTDSSGSKGVSIVSNVNEISNAINLAYKFSRNKRIIAEEFIDNKLADIHGDGFIVDGELIFSSLGDHIYNSKANPFNPIGTTWPSSQSSDVINKIEIDVARIIKGTGFRNGPVNIEARVNSKGIHYIMEIGPRSGGHFVPNAIHYSTGFNMVKATLDALIGNKISIPGQIKKYAAYYAIHCDYDGKLIQLSINDKLEPFIKEFHQYVLPGEEVKSFLGANAAIGILIMAFNNREQMEYIFANMQKFVDLKIDKIMDLQQNL